MTTPAAPSHSTLLRCSPNPRPSVQSVSACREFVFTHLCVSERHADISSVPPQQIRPSEPSIHLTRSKLHMRIMMKEPWDTMEAKRSWGDRDRSRGDTPLRADVSEAAGFNYMNLLACRIPDSGAWRRTGLLRGEIYRPERPGRSRWIKSGSKDAFQTPPERALYNPEFSESQTFTATHCIS